MPANFKQFSNGRKQDSTVTVQWLGRGLDSPGFESWQRKYIQISSWADQASYLMGTGVTSRGLIGQGMMLTTHLQLVTGLRMSGAIPLLPLYTFMVQKNWTIKLCCI